MSTRRAWIIATWLLLVSLQTGWVRSEDQTEPSPETPTVAADHAPVDQPAESEDRKAEKQRKAMAGLMALCGILIGGLMLVVVVMFWGARLRRIARRELPAQKTLDKDLWFLKPPKTPPE